MKTFASLASFLLTLLMALAGAAQAATFVYVSNAEDGDIGTYTLLPDGSLLPGARVAAGKPVMPMSVSPDRRFLYAAVRSKPFAVITYAIDRKTGALSKRSGAALAESFPYIAVDKTGSCPARRVLWRPPRQRQRDREGRQSVRPQAGDPDRPQRPLDHHRQHQPLRLRAAPGHRPDLPVPLRREDRPADREHPAGGPDEGRVRPAPHHHVAPTTDSPTCSTS